MKIIQKNVFIVLIIVCAIVFFLFKSEPRLDVNKNYPPKKAGDIYGPELPRDVKTYATVADYEKTTGKKIPPYKESPMLGEQVKKGEMESVEQRLPRDPLVVEPYESIGQYGGMLRVDAKSWRDYMHHGLFRRNSGGSEIIPDLAKGYKYTNNYKSITFFLRNGLKWSDGIPFTVDDIIYVWEDEVCNDQLNPSGTTMPYLGAVFNKIDDYTLRIDFPKPMPNYMAAVSHPYTLAQSQFFNPKHYLKKWHIKYNPEANELAKKEGFENWTQAYLFHSAKWKIEERPGLPTLNAWLVTKYVSGYGLAVRNPYFFQVDTEGNQLPYIDKLLAIKTKFEDTQSKIILMLGGQLDHLWGFGELSIDDYPFLKENEKKCNYRIVAFPSTYKSAMTVSLNPRVPDPVLNKIFNNVKFRQALSLAIDRDSLNNSVYLGLGIPRQDSPLPTVSYYKEEWGNYCIQYDPEKANALLDELGLKWDNSHKYRLRSDGNPLDLLIESGHGTEPEAYCQEVIAGQWEKIGIKLTMKTEKLSSERFQSEEFELIICDNGGQETELDYEGGEPYFLNQGMKWNTWLTQFIDAGQAPKDINVGVEPPDEWIQFAKQIYEASRLVPGSPEWIRLKQEIGDTRMNQLWHIGTVYKVPVFDLVSNRVGNFPKVPWFGWTSGAGVVLQPQQWYLKKK